MSKQSPESSEQRPANLTALKHELAEIAAKAVTKGVTIEPLPG